MPMTGCRSTGTGDRVEQPWHRGLIMVILIALGVSALVGLLGYALIVGPAFFN